MNMSYALTTRQVRQREKSVTRRLRWRSARVGQVVQPIVKAQGLKKCEHVERINGPIRFTGVRFEPLSRMTDDPDYGRAECIKEGFPGLTPWEFVRMFCVANKCEPSVEVTRIEFEYLQVASAATIN